MRDALRRSEDRLLGRGVRFVLTGGIVMAVYLSTTTVLASVMGVAFQIALAIGFCAGLVVHFTLQRTFVWVHSGGFALPFHHQMARYLISAGLQYGLTAASTSLLPAALGLPTELVYVCTVALATLLNFLVFRRLIFHAKPGGTDARCEAAGAAGVPREEADRPLTAAAPAETAEAPRVPTMRG